jgi:hypothetical protein
MPRPRTRQWPLSACNAQQPIRSSRPCHRHGEPGQRPPAYVFACRVPLCASPQVSDRSPGHGPSPQQPRLMLTCRQHDKYRHPASRSAGSQRSGQSSLQGMAPHPCRLTLPGGSLAAPRSPGVLCWSWSLIHRGRCRLISQCKIQTRALDLDDPRQCRRLTTRFRYVCIGRKPGSGSSSRHRHSDSRSHQSSKSAKHGDSRKRARHG